MTYINGTIFARIKCIIKSHVFRFLKINSTKELISRHFDFWSETLHHTRNGISIGMQELNDKPSVILETGTSAWGCDSSRLFDSYVRIFGGNFFSVDLRPEASEWLKFQTCGQSQFYIGDSVEFLKNELPKLEISKIDLCYLDSFDVDFSDPLPSAKHGFSEYNAVRNYLQRGSILIVVDTPSEERLIPKEFLKIALQFREKYGVLPGKGAFIIKELNNNGEAEVLEHSWGVVFKFLK